MDRLRQRGTRDQASNCLIWPVDKCDEQGYGQVRWNGKLRYVHRVVLMDKLGVTELDPNILARHSPKCVSRACFERDHIQAGTSRQNSYNDKLAAGTLLFGEKNPNATISNDLAKQIKHSFYPIGHELYQTKQARADKFGVTRSMVNNIDHGMAFAFIPDRGGNVTDNLERRDKLIIWRRQRKEKAFSEELIVKGRERLFESSYESTETSYNGIPCRLMKKVGKEGYGRICVLGREFKAHQLACVIKSGRFREKWEDTRHLCNIRGCIEETHLEFGSGSDNQKDSREYSKNSKLSMKKAEQVKEMYTTGEFTFTTLAELFNVSDKTISNIIKGKTWVPHKT